MVLRLNPITIIPYSLITSQGVSFQVSGPDSGNVIIDSSVSLDPPVWQPVFN